MDIIDRLREFLENEARSCSMDFACVTPEYVYRSWGGRVAIDEIATGLTELRKQGTFMVHGSCVKVKRTGGRVCPGGSGI